MIDLTFEQISDAKNNDLSAVTAVIEATEERVLQLARRFAGIGGRLDENLCEDLAQIGRIAVWEGISRFTGSTVAEFFVFVDTTVQGHMSNERKSERRQGVSREVAAIFETALSLANGDAYAAEKIAQDAEMVTAKRRLSPEMALAARLSYQGMQSLDVPVGGGADGLDGDMTLADLLAEKIGVPADLLEPSDFERARRQATTDQVHATLDRMGRQNQIVLKALTGIDPIGFYGTEHDEELSTDHGIARNRIKVIRSLGKAKFAEMYAAAYSI
jgi:DNA-directed RNA polymerase specialized sigma subunit